MKVSIKKLSLITVVFLGLSLFGCESEAEEEMFEKVDDKVEKLYSEEKERVGPPD